MTRREFHPLLLEFMRQDPRIIVLLGDLGFGMFDAIMREFPDRCINVGAREQAMLGAAVGLALMGKIPIVFSITPFAIKRPFEWLDNYLNREGIPVKILGGGRDGDYAEDGYTHDAHADEWWLESLGGIRGFWPEEIAGGEWMTREWLYNGKPSYLNLRR